MRRGWPALLLTLGTACSDPEAQVTPPPIDADFVMFGTAQSGRTLTPGSVRVLTTGELGPVTPDPIAGGKIDMVFAGLKQSDLPVGMRPSDLVFVTDRDEPHRPLPPLYDAHVFEEPVELEEQAELVPVELEGAPKSLLEDRAHRFETMLSGLRVRNPCKEPGTKFEVTTPPIPSDAILNMQTYADGTTLLGLSTSGTVAFALIEAGRKELDFTIANTGTVALVMEGEAASVVFVSSEIIQTPEGIRPDALTLYIESGFGSVGLLLRWNEARARYIDISPRLSEAFPRTLEGSLTLELSDGPAFCTYGGVQGATRRAAIWCLRNGSNQWTVVGDFPRSFTITRMVARPNGQHLAFDLAGGVYQLDGERWTVVSQTSINADCDPPCASFTTTALDTSGGDLIGVLAGAKAQFLLVRDTGAVPEAKPPPALNAALFGDERSTAVVPLRYSAIDIAPDGSIFLASTIPDLFRISADRLTVDRICLPKSLRDTPIASIEAHPDGRLYLGMVPALIAFSRWDDL